MIVSHACGICGAGFGCDAAAFAAHMHAVHQIETLTPCVMMSREEYESLTARATARDQRIAALETALEPLRVKLMGEWWREDEKDWYVTCTVCDATGPRENFWHFTDCTLGALLAAAGPAARDSEPKEAGAGVANLLLHPFIETLFWYADPANYAPHGVMLMTSGAALEDRGQRARDTLADNYSPASAPPARPGEQEADPT